jgi:hypothetical protein
MITNKIEAYLNNKGKEITESILEEVSLLARWSFERQFGLQKESEYSLRLSSIGKCIRQQSYNVLGFEKNGKEIDARAKTVFFQGDMVEMAIVQLAKVSGCNIIDCGKDQKTVELDGIPGHPDGIFINEFNKKFLLEVKSMSSYSFSDFQNGQIDEGYLFQINSYLEALGLEECVMVGLNKDAGVLHEHLVKRNPSFIARIKATIDYLKHCQEWLGKGETKETALLPDRPYSPNDKGIYPWQCNYCAHRGTCLPDAELILIKNKYQLKVKENAT